jgi:hypothetical protein
MSGCCEHGFGLCPHGACTALECSACDAEAELRPVHKIAREDLDAFVDLSDRHQGALRLITDLYGDDGRVREELRTHGLEPCIDRRRPTKRR